MALALNKTTTVKADIANDEVSEDKKELELNFLTLDLFLLLEYSIPLRLLSVKFKLYK